MIVLHIHLLGCAFIGWVALVSQYGVAALPAYLDFDCFAGFSEFSAMRDAEPESI